MKVISLLNDFWTKFINLGISGYEASERDIRIQMLNRVALISCAFGIIYLISFFAFNLLIQAYVMIGFIFLFFLVIYFNYKGFFRVAKFIYIVSSNLGILFFSLMLGFKSGIHLFVILCPVFNLSVFHPSSYLSIALSTLVYLITLILTILLNSDVFQTPLPLSNIFFFYTTVILFIIFLITILFYYLKKKTSTYIEQLEKQNQELRESYQSLEQFNYMASHNLRAPIANLMGLSDLFGSSPKHDKEIIKLVQISAYKLNDVVKDINDILNLKKIEEKEQVVNLIEQINTACEMNGVDVNNVELIDNVKKIVSIKSFIHNIFFNLISNSFKYRNPHKTLQISIEINKVEGQVVIIYEDNGLGIDLDRNKEKIFKMYTKFHKEGDGKGLGLYLVKSQIGLLKGSIEIESKVNIGTKFIIKLNDKKH